MGYSYSECRILYHRHYNQAETFCELVKHLKSGLCAFRSAIVARDIPLRQCRSGAVAVETRCNGLAHFWGTEIGGGVNAPTALLPPPWIIPLTNTVRTTSSYASWSAIVTSSPLYQVIIPSFHSASVRLVLSELTSLCSLRSARGTPSASTNPISLREMRTHDICGTLTQTSFLA